MHVGSIAVVGFEGAIQYGQSLPEEDNSFSFVFTVDDAKTLHKTMVRKTIEYGEQFSKLSAGQTATGFICSRVPPWGLSRRNWSTPSSVGSNVRVRTATPSDQLKQHGRWNRRR